MPRPRPVILTVLDGWGISPLTQGNAIALAHKPVMDTIQAHYPSISLQASGIAVGLPWGEMGNSETGHLTMGAGFVVYQNLPRISLSIQNGSFFKVPAFLNAAQHVRINHSRLHIVGILSGGGIHGHVDHITGLLEFAQQQGISEVLVHAITDGRDTPADVALQIVTEFEQRAREIGVGKIATVGGRFYGMDRNENWDRTKLYYDAMVTGEAPRASSATTAIEASYANKIYDEQILPVIITENGVDLPRIQTGDAVIFANFRPDRARQLTKAIALPHFAKFERKKSAQVAFVTMTEYEEHLPVQIAFQTQLVEHPLASVISRAGLKQIHIAETEKYAHVTYFLDGGVETPFPNEDFILVPSANVASYEERPEMSCKEITDKVIDAIASENYDFIVVNYANADMVGHTGNLEAATKAIEAFDNQFGRLLFTVLEQDAVLIITGDHGNAEAMIDPESGKIDKEHSTNPVPFIVIHKGLQISGSEKDVISRMTRQLNPQGSLTDVAPTILDIMGLEKPAQMTGKSLLTVMGVKLEGK